MEVMLVVKGASSDVEVVVLHRDELQNLIHQTDP